MQQKKSLDIKINKQRQAAADFRLAIKNNVSSSSTLFSKGKRTQNFFTEDSKLYITPSQQQLLRNGAVLNHNLHGWDNISSRIVTKFVRYQPSEASLLLKSLEKRYDLFNDVTGDAARNFLGQFSTARLWNASILGSILFGMVMMTFVYKYLGQGASAKQVEPVANSQQQIVNKEIVLRAADTGNDAASFAEQMAQIEQAENTESLELEIGEMVEGYPIEKMVPEIAKQDPIVAAFIVAIAKKESAWGQRVPVLGGQDCYNYWGYRGIRDRMGTGGHTCFDSPEDAVKTVAKRINTLVEEYGKTTPEEMVIWKCGNSCAATGGQTAANKWISDVRYVFNKFDIKE